MRLLAATPHGFDCRSMFFQVRASSPGTFSCSSTRFWRIWMIFIGCSMNTGHTSWHAPQVVHAHSVSSAMRPPVIRGISTDCFLAAASWARVSSRSGCSWPG